MQLVIRYFIIVSSLSISDRILLFPGENIPEKEVHETPTRIEQSAKCLCVAASDCLISVLSNKGCSSTTKCCPVEQVTQEGFLKLLSGINEADEIKVKACTCVGNSSCSFFDKSTQSGVCTKGEFCCPNNNLINTENQDVVCTCVRQKYCSQKIYATAVDAKNKDCRKGNICCPNTKFIHEESAGVFFQENGIIQRCRCIDKFKCKSLPPTTTAGRSQCKTKNQICCPDHFLLEEIKTTIFENTTCNCVPKHLCNITTENTKEINNFINELTKETCKEVNKVCCPKDRVILLKNEDCNCIHEEKCREPEYLQRNTDTCVKPNLCCRNLMMENLFKCGLSLTNPKFDKRKRPDGEALYTEFPWMMAIYANYDEYSESDSYSYEGKSRNETFICNGIFIHPFVVLTSANCLSRYGDIPLRVKPDKWDLKSFNIHYDHFLFNVVRKEIHPNFSSNPLENDIALLFLPKNYKPIDISTNTNTICFVSEDVKYDRSKCIVSGWVHASSGNVNPILQKSSAGMVSESSCSHTKSSFLYAKSIQNDSMYEGAPLVCRINRRTNQYILVGFRNSLKCNLKDDIKVYNSPTKFITWVTETIRKELHNKTLERYYLFKSNDVYVNNS